MASAAVMTAVGTLIAANWTYTPILGLNDKGSVPEDNSAYLEVQYPVGGEDMASIGAPGANLWRTPGGIRVVLCVPIGQGINEPAAPWITRLDALRAALRGQTLGGGFIILWGAGPVNTNDDSDDGAYFVLSFAVEYQADVIG